MSRFPRCEYTGPYVGWGSLESNHHGPRVDGEATTLRSTVSIVFLDNGMMPPPRFYWGVRLWIYARSGRCWNFDLCFRWSRRYEQSEVERARRAELYVAQQKARGEWPPSVSVGPDYLAAMLGAHGLGLKLVEKPVE